MPDLTRLRLTKIWQSTPKTRYSLVPLIDIFDFNLKIPPRDPTVSWGALLQQRCHEIKIQFDVIETLAVWREGPGARPPPPLISDPDPFIVGTMLQNTPARIHLGAPVICRLRRYSPIVCRYVVGQGVSDLRELPSCRPETDRKRMQRFELEAYLAVIKHMLGLLDTYILGTGEGGSLHHQYDRTALLLLRLVVLKSQHAEIMSSSPDAYTHTGYKADPYTVSMSLVAIMGARYTSEAAVCRLISTGGSLDGSARMLL